jgi:uncharacterized protein YbjT (DUF2867 family)
VIDETQKQHPDLRIRAVTRDDKSKAAEALRKRGIEIAKAEMSDEASLVEAFKV